jgi:hypothetical protein
MIFMWLVAEKAILTKDNMIRKNWKGNPGCYFCGSLETVDHLLFSCPVAKVVWGLVETCFGQPDRPTCYEQFWPWIKKALPGGEQVYMLCLAVSVGQSGWQEIKSALIKKPLKDPNDIVFAACALMRYWKGLYSEEAQVMIQAGVETMMRMAVQLMKRSRMLHHY